MNLIISLSLGLMLGLFLNIKKQVLKVNSHFQLVILFLLLFAMGISLGIDPDIVSNLRNIGLTAFIFSLGTVGFSILFVYVASKLIRRWSI